MKILQLFELSLSSRQAYRQPPRGEGQHRRQPVRQRHLQNRIISLSGRGQNPRQRLKNIFSAIILKITVKMISPTMGKLST